MYKLVSFDLCPFVQRSLIVLNEKEIPYDITYIDLSNKPDWFLELSPTGKVPVVQTEDGDTLFESAVINEFLDESHEPRFMPDTPLARARQRMWIDFTGGIFGDVFRLYTAATREAAEENLAKAQAKLDRLVEEVEGNLFAGDDFSLVDAAVAPAFSRLAWVDRLVPDMNIFANEKVTVWKDNILARESVKNSLKADIFDLFVASSKKRGTWVVDYID